MRIAVKDASILIDLAEGDLLGLWFRLEIETHTTDLVLREVKHEAQWRRVSPFVDAKLLQVHPTAAADIGAVVAFSQTHGISLPDASGVFLARRLQACLLTGDRRLRHTAETDESRPTDCSGSWTSWSVAACWPKPKPPVACNR